MITDIIAFALTHPFVAGLMIGGACFGTAFGTIGWCLGYEKAMRRVAGWLQPKVDEAHGDVPNLPPARRFISTTPGRS